MTTKQEAHAARKAAELASTVQQTMNARNAATSMVGERLGAPMDFTKGIPLGTPQVGSQKAPNVPRVHTPMPPEEAFVDEERIRAAQAAAAKATASGGRPLSDAGYEAMRNGDELPPEAPPPPPSNRRQAPKIDPIGKKPTHPLLKQLRSEFGLAGEDAKPPVEIQVAEHVWSFIQPTPDMIAFAAQLADTLASTATEHELRTQHAILTGSIVAVDGIPVWEMFGLEPGERDDVSKPLNPKGPIRRRAALMLFNELTEQHSNKLLEVLYEAYKAKVDVEGEALSYAFYESIKAVSWSCPVEGCGKKIYREVKQNESGEIMPYFCEDHGVALERSSPGTALSESLSPLR